jgi:hypothetical protein
MRIPHEFVPGDEQQQLLDGTIETVCQVCVYPANHFNHRAPENIPALLGELYDFVVDNVSVGKINPPPNRLLSRCSKVLSR